MSEELIKDRDVRRSLKRGWRRKCPNCGAGPVLKGYLKVRNHCAVCGQDLMHHRADDGPAYLTILITGHATIPFFNIGFAVFDRQPVLVASIISVGCVALALYLLPRIKGAMVGFQLAKRMHGFARA